MSSPGALPADAKAVEDKLNFLFNVAIGVTAAMLVTTSMAVALRTYVRTRIVKTFGWDDITMLMAQVCRQVPIRYMLSSCSFFL